MVQVVTPARPVSPMHRSEKNCRSYVRQNVDSLRSAMPATDGSREKEGNHETSEKSRLASVNHLPWRGATSGSLNRGDATGDLLHPPHAVAVPRSVG